MVDLTKNGNGFLAKKLNIKANIEEMC